MAEVKLQQGVEVIVSNNGLVTLIADTGDVCFIYVHPADQSKLVKYLVKLGYSFT